MAKTYQTIMSIVLLAIAALWVMPGRSFAQVGCSQQDQQLIVEYTQRLMEAIMLGNLVAMVQLNQEIESALSPGCVQALMAAQQYQQLQQFGGSAPYSYGTSPPSVYNHGGGTYSVPGLGACGPSGCISFD